MKIIELGISNSNNSELTISLSSSFNLEGSKVSLGALMNQGSAGLLNWKLEFAGHDPVILKAESVLNVKDRTMLKIPHALGNTFLFEGQSFNAVGKSSEYLILDRKVDGLGTGSRIEVFGASYKYDIVIHDVKIEDIKSAVVTVTTGGESEKREIRFNT